MPKKQSKPAPKKPKETKKQPAQAPKLPKLNDQPGYGHSPQRRIVI